MPWVKLEDGFYTHPKLLSVSVSARWLFVAALCFSNQNATDGVVSVGAADGIGCIQHARRAVEELVAAGLWEPDPEGYRIHDYHLYQPSREKILHDRALAAERQAKWRNNAGNGTAS